MSRREEIKKKETLQLLFQQAIRQNHSKVNNWLKPSTTKATKNSDFLNLPIIELGKSLNSISSQTENFQTFLENDKGTTKKLQSKAMNSLMNRIRQDNKNKINKQAGRAGFSKHNPKGKPVGKPQGKYARSSTRQQDSDSSDDDSDHATHVKKPKLLF